MEISLTYTLRSSFRTRFLTSVIEQGLSCKIWLLTAAPAQLIANQASAGKNTSPTLLRSITELMRD